MAVGKMKIVKKACAYVLSASLAIGMMAPVTRGNAAGEVTTTSSGFENKYESEGYKLTWNDEFDGTALNTKDWNVEEHEPGWVNAELQRYVSEKDMNDNIKVKDGVLKLIPTASKKADADSSKPAVAEVLKSNDFSETNWAGRADGDGKATFDYKDGKALVNIEKPGTENWHVQLQQTGLTLKPGHEYEFKVKATSDADRAVEVSLLDPENGYDWYGGRKLTIAKDKENELTFKAAVAADKKESSTIALQLNFGAIGDMADISTKANVTLSEVSLVDLSADASGGVDVTKAYDYTSGRINTQNKRDFKYGRFEARAKVPTGKGYLPAFWLMATDETNYGQWPQCGEIDIMEVKGQEVNKSLHTIHYGYNSTTGHNQQQGEKELSSGEGSFADERHTFRLDWEPGKLTWFVDDEEVYTTSEWFTGKNKESELTYPAPFDQEFYVILNLAVGGNWVGYPDQAVVDDMANQSYDVDYVRVYQKDASVYEAAEANVKKPESAKNKFREADANGNYVLNADFAKDINGIDPKDKLTNWGLHLESDAKGSSYKVENNSIKITPAAEGSVTHAVQLLQQGIPMYRGWEYELTFDAVADEDRTMVVDVEGPDHGWTRYMADTTFDITKEKKTYTKTFTMEEATDPNGSLEFNLGNQKSLAGVTISNVKLIHKSGTLIPEDTSKTVAADGNYLYNGTFDQGESRLGNWKVSDASNVSVTNKNKVRELKVTVKDNKPVTITQDELAPLSAGEYDFRFDARMEDGSAADGIIANVSGNEFTPELTTANKTYVNKFKVEKSLERKDSKVTITFAKNGTYYLDNVMLSEASMVKNGSFTSGLAGYAPYVYTNDLASYVVDVLNNDSSFVMTINNTGTEDWHVQLNQYNINLEKGKTYKVSFKAKSTINRQITYGLTQYEGAWTNYSKTFEPVSLTTEWQTFGTTFTMDDPSDSAARLNFSMGKIADKQIVDKHEVLIDDIVLEEVTGAADASSDASSEATEVTEAKITENVVSKDAFSGNTALKSVIIGKKVTKINANAFKGCKNLKSIKIYGNKLKSVNKTAFKRCTNKKSVKVTIYAKSKKVYKKVVKMVKKAGLKKATYKYKKKK